MAASCCACMAWGIIPPRVSVVVLAPWAFAVRLGPRASWSRACRVRQRLVCGGDLSCEAETCRGDPSSGELVGDVTNWPKTKPLASVGLDQGPYSPCPESLPSRYRSWPSRCQWCWIVVCLEEIISPSKGALIRVLVSSLEPERESRSRAQTQLDDLGVDGVLHVLDGCV
jgi:hypothetical protein